MSGFASRKQEIAGRFSRAASGYAAHAQLQAGIADALLALADFHGTVLDAGCGRGRESRRLADVASVNGVIALDIAPAMLADLAGVPKIRPLLGDIEAIPLPDAAVDMVFSNFAMQWCESRARAAAEVARVLAPDGSLLFSVPGPGSLAALQSTGLLHVNAFAGVGAWMEALSLAGFIEPEIVQREFTAWFDTPRDLLHALKGLGANTADSPRGNHLLGRQWWRRVEAALEAQRDVRGLPLTYDVILVRARRAVGG